MNTVTEIQPTHQVELTPDGWTMNLYGKRAAIIKSPEGKKITSYFGFDTDTKAREFKSWIEGNNKDGFRYCSKCSIRPSERLSTQFEVKVWNCPAWLIEDSFNAEMKQDKQQKQGDLNDT